MEEYNQIEERLITNIAAIPAIGNTESFAKFTRRNVSNIFNALFYDKEIITEDAINERVCKTANFFNLPVPMLLRTSECLAQISFSEIIELGSEIRYDLVRLEELGINNLDAFDAILTHEIAHQFLSDLTFNFCVNQNWAKELACDYFVGYRFGLENMATGKYKFIVSHLKESDTHPAGSFRIESVIDGYEFGCKFREDMITHNADYALVGFNVFLCSHSKLLNDSYDIFLNSPEEKDKHIHRTPVEALSDSNLIKQIIVGKH